MAMSEWPNYSGSEYIKGKGVSCAKCEKWFPISEMKQVLETGFENWFCTSCYPKVEMQVREMEVEIGRHTGEIRESELFHRLFTRKHQALPHQQREKYSFSHIKKVILTMIEVILKFSLIMAAGGACSL
jgi:hypothetical protein